MCAVLWRNGLCAGLLAGIERQFKGCEFKSHQSQLLKAFNNQHAHWHNQITCCFLCQRHLNRFKVGINYAKNSKIKTYYWENDVTMVLKRHQSSVTFPKPFRVSSNSSPDAHLATLLHSFEMLDNTVRDSSLTCTFSLGAGYSQRVPHWRCQPEGQQPHEEIIKVLWPFFLLQLHPIWFLCGFPLLTCNDVILW